jgi:tetratricopeptide (TPR) repeat protein
MPEPPRIFVSHSHADNSWCRQFVALLRETGADVWYDETNLKYDRLTTQISREIESRPFFFVVLSPEAVTSEWVNSEWGAAFTFKIDDPSRRVLVPIVVRKCDIPALLRDYLRIQAADMTPKAAADEVIANVLKLRAPDATLSATTSEPQTVDEAVTLGQSLLAQGRYDDALGAFSLALSLDGESVSALLGKGDALESLGRPEDALRAYGDAVTCAPTDTQAWATRGRYLGQIGRFDDALNDLNHALHLNPNLLGAWSNKSNMLRHLGRYDEALAAAERAILIDAQSGAVWVAKGNALMRLNRHAEALAAYELALVLTTPDSRLSGTPARNRAVLLTNKAKALLSLGQRALALATYEDALGVDTSYAAAWNGKGNVLLQQGQNERALDAYAHAFDCAPEAADRARAYFGKGEGLNRLGRFEEARDALKEAIRLDASLSGARRALGQAYLALRSSDKAIQVYQEAIERGEDVAEAWNGIGSALAQLGQQNEALAALMRSIASPGASLRPWFNRIELLQGWGRAEEAAKAEAELWQYLRAQAFTNMARESRSHAL